MRRLLATVVIVGSLTGCSAYQRVQYNRGFSKAYRMLDPKNGEKKLSHYWSGFFNAFQLRLLELNVKEAKKAARGVRY